jgi:L-arabinose isomerase
MFTRVGLLALHWAAFDATMPHNYRLEKEKLANDVFHVLRSSELDVVYPGLVTDEATGSAVGEVFESVDAVVVVPTMAAPAAFGWAALSRVPTLPVVIWNMGTLPEIGEGFDAEDLVRHSSNVGTAMLANVLRRQGRRFRVCTVRNEDPNSYVSATRVVKSAAAASKLRKARLGMIGPPIGGYLNVAVDPHTLRETLGINLVRISKAEHELAYASVTAAETERILAEIADWSCVEGSDHELERSAKLTATLANLVRTNRLDGGTVNCRTEFFLNNPQIGIVACVAVSYLLRRGVPFTCTGDLPAAIAELMLKLVGLPAQWCECNVIDFAGDYVLLSTTGEGDPELAADREAIRIVKNRRFAHEGCGACLQYPFACGDATLIGLSPQPLAEGGWTLTMAEGKLIDRYFPRIGVPNGAFAFRRGTAVSLDAWYESGPTHHAVVTRGYQTELLTNLAYFLGIEARCI